MVVWRVSYSRAYSGKRLYGPGKWGHNVAETLVPTPRATSVAGGHKYCVRDTKNVSDFVQKHFVSATNVSQFAQHGNTTFILRPARLRPDQISWATMGSQQRVCNHLSLCQGPSATETKFSHVRFLLNNKVWILLGNTADFFLHAVSENCFFSSSKLTGWA